MIKSKSIFNRKYKENAKAKEAEKAKEKEAEPKKAAPPAQSSGPCCPHPADTHYGGAKGWCNVDGCSCQEFKRP